MHASEASTAVRKKAEHPPNGACIAKKRRKRREDNLTIQTSRKKQQVLVGFTAEANGLLRSEATNDNAMSCVWRTRQIRLGDEGENQVTVAWLWDTRLCKHTITCITAC